MLDRIDQKDLHKAFRAYINKYFTNRAAAIRHYKTEPGNFYSMYNHGTCPNVMAQMMGYKRQVIYTKIKSVDN